jgi:ribosomal protein S27AE
MRLAAVINDIRRVNYMELSQKQELRIMPKLRCPRCEKSNMYYDDNTLSCAECGYELTLFKEEKKPS